MESAEHAWIGDQLSLKFGVVTKNAKDHKFQIAGEKQMQLTYGLIVALAGDLYGVPAAPISTAKDPRKAFQDAWESLANGDDSELRNIVRIMGKEITAFDHAIIAGNPSEMYGKLGDQLSLEWNGATGGSDVTFLLPGRYLNLSAKNWDHFGH